MATRCGPYDNLTNRRFDRLVVIKPHDVIKGGWRWLCRCDDGNEVLVLGARLKAGITRSCGCLKHEASTTNRYKHGHAKMRGQTRTYRKWCAMLQRCNNPANPGYKYYGKRGITVCERWLIFENFLADMGPCPPGLTLHRVDNDGNYEPGNCKWATWSEQMKVRRRWAFNQKRDAEICAKRKAGQTTKTLSAEYSLTRQRIHVICRKAMTAPIP